MNHTPVLLQSALELLAVRPDGTYVDATFGNGGHSRELLSRLTSGQVIALDADPAAIARAGSIRTRSFTFVHANFSELARALDSCGVKAVDGVLFDLGVSSMQIDEAQRGFSFAQSAPLDMRMNPDAGMTAYDVLATSSERELADIFFHYGQERAARVLARTIVRRRDAGKLPTTTTEFAALVAGVVNRGGARRRIHPATRAFQALRIAVNDELDALRVGLSVAIDRLRGAGRIVAISFHSLEDRIVKNAFRGDSRLTVITRKPVRADSAEVARNSRARSAKLRAAERKENS